MSLDTIIDQCVTTTLTVAGIGVVHDHEMYISDRKGLLANFTSSGVINACEIDRDRTPADRMSNFRTERQHRLSFHFYYGLSESGDTRPTFRALIEAAHDVFVNDYTLSGTAKLAGPFVVDFDGYIEKCGVLLHYAHCTLVAKDEV